MGLEQGTSDRGQVTVAWLENSHTHNPLYGGSGRGRRCHP